jgi:hypothetical protein
VCATVEERPFEGRVRRVESVRASAPVFVDPRQSADLTSDQRNENASPKAHAAIPQLYNFAVTRPSTAGTILLIIFGGVFLSAGLFFASTLLFAAPGSVQGNQWVGVVISTIFILIGGGIFCGTIYGNRRLREKMSAEVSNPRSPWLWRKDWAASRAESRNRNVAYGLWAAAIFWNAISLTVAATTMPALWRASDPKAFFPLIFVVVGVILAGLATRATIRRKRFGQTYFEFASLPFSPGRELKGAIHLRLDTDARHGVDLSLSCVRRVVVGSGKNRSTNESVLWQANKNVPRELLIPGPTGDAVIPVDFGIPSDAYESNSDRPDDQVVWVLHAQADVPGVDYSDDFEVPVFRRIPQPGSASEPTGSFQNKTQGSDDAQPATVPPAFQTDASDVPAPTHPKVVVSVGVTGTEFYFPAFRNPTRTVLTIFFTAVWTGLIYLIGHSKAPSLFAIVFGFFDLVLIYAVIQSTTGTFHIEVGNAKLILRRAVLGIASAREVPFSNIAQILAVCPVVGQGTKPFYSLRLLTKDGKKLTIADAIDDRQEARWIVAQLEKFVGLKLDTHVAVEGRFANYGPPPQRGQATSGSPAAYQRKNPAAIAVAIGFLLVWTGFMVFRFTSRDYAPRARSQSPGPSQIRIFSAARDLLSDD